MNIDSTKTARLEELQGKIIKALTEIKELQVEVDYKTSDFVKKLNPDPETSNIVIELLLAMAGIIRVPVDESC